MTHIMIPAAGVFAGVTAYTWQDVNFTVIGYVWIIIWYTFAVFEMVYVKKVVDTVKMTTWSRTYYQVTCRASKLQVTGPLPQNSTARGPHGCAEWASRSV